MAVSLIETTEPTDSKTFAVHGGPTLEAHLPQTFVQTFTQRTARDFRMKLAAESAVSVPLERRVGSASVGEQVRGQCVVGELVALGCKQIAT